MPGQDIGLPVNVAQINFRIAHLLYSFGLLRDNKMDPSQLPDLQPGRSYSTQTTDDRSVSVVLSEFDDQKTRLLKRALVVPELKVPDDLKALIEKPAWLDYLGRSSVGAWHNLQNWLIIQIYSRPIDIYATRDALKRVIDDLWTEINRTFTHSLTFKSYVDMLRLVFRIVLNESEIIDAH